MSLAALFHRGGNRSMPITATLAKHLHWENRAPQEKFKQMQDVFWVMRQPPKEGWCLSWG